MPFGLDFKSFTKVLGLGVATGSLDAAAFGPDALKGLASATGGMPGAVPAPTDTPKAPSADDPAVAAAAEEERKRQRAARGRASTQLTGGAGLLDTPSFASVMLGR